MNDDKYVIAYACEMGDGADVVGTEKEAVGIAMAVELAIISFGIDGTVAVRTPIDGGEYSVYLKDFDKGKPTVQCGKYSREEWDTLYKEAVESVVGMAVATAEF